MGILAKVFDRGAHFPVRHMSFNFNQSQSTLFKDNPWGEYGSQPCLLCFLRVSDFLYIV